LSADVVLNELFGLAAVSFASTIMLSSPPESVFVAEENAVVAAVVSLITDVMSRSATAPPSGAADTETVMVSPVCNGRAVPTAASAGIFVLTVST
jgi:hypothetical protein